jgi:hypothetical protein
LDMTLVLEFIIAYSYILLVSPLECMN